MAPTPTSAAQAATATRIPVPAAEHRSQRRTIRRVSTPVFFRPDAERPRRALNVLVAGLGLLLTAPVMLLVAALVKLTSRGPVFYTQTRIGLDRRDPKIRSINYHRGVDLGGAPFRIYKFRTMAIGASSADAQVWASPTDPRVTRIGGFLRKYRVDELPQLWNVLRGDMNVVGPRPEQPRIFSDLRGKIDSYQHRQRVRPGITGWAQINLHYDKSLDDVRKKVSYDLEYIGRQSVLEDLRIMVRTVPVMLFKKGAW
jgi:lipopolysaccharide/colanic/teichoic acid biosynthesis glycosyltransferase